MEKTMVLMIGIPGSGKNSPNGREKDVFINCENLEDIDVDPDNRFLSGSMPAWPDKWFQTACRVLAKSVELF